MMNIPFLVSAMCAAVLAASAWAAPTADSLRQVESVGAGLYAAQYRHYAALTSGKPADAAVSAADAEAYAREMAGRLLPAGLTETEDGRKTLTESPGAAIACLPFVGADGIRHVFSVWVTPRVRRPLAWVAAGYPVRSASEFSDAEKFLMQTILVTSTDAKRTVRMTSGPVGTNVCVKGVISGRVRASPFERAYVAFVDDDPFANWGHACRYVFVKDDLSAFAVLYAEEPMSVEAAGSRIELKTIEDALPSAGSDTPKKVRKAINELVYVSPEHASPACRNGDTAHSYAVLISGGANVLNNHTRYWGDTAAVYGLLTRRYGFAKENIQVLMSDGTSPEQDISAHSSSHRYFFDRSSPLDLDGDGVADVMGPATTNAVRQTFADLKAKLTADDQLFVFVTDHGGRNDAGDCYLCLWNSTSMSVPEFAALTEGLPCPVVYAFEFCYSGAFADTLVSQGGVRVVAAAASVETSSAWSNVSKVTGVSAADGLPYMDPWVYYFVGAAGGWFPSVSLSPWNETASFAEADGEGEDDEEDHRISVAEAAAYAKAKIEADGYPETPLYAESSAGAGESLFLVKDTPAWGHATSPLYLSVVGPVEVGSGETAGYSCRAFSDGPDYEDVVPTWSLDVGPGIASIDEQGRLTAAGNLPTNAVVTVWADYTDGVVSRRGNMRAVVRRAPPANDDFANAAVISGVSGSLTATSEGATYETGEPLVEYRSSATKSVWWTWTAPTAGTLTVTTANSDFDTVLGVYTGTALASLAVVAQSDDDATLSGGASKCSFRCTEGTTYCICVAGYGGKTGTVKLNWDLKASSSITLADSVDNALLIFATGGDVGWFGQDEETHDGTDAARSGAIDHGQSSWMKTTVTGSGTLSFWWYVNSESVSYDYLSFSIDGAVTNRIGGLGEVWTRRTYVLPSGTHELKWTYSKDGSLSKGSDAGFVDQVVWTPGSGEPTLPDGVYVRTVDGIDWTFRVSAGTASVGAGTRDQTAVAETTYGAITVPDSFDGIPVTAIADYAFYDCYRVTSVTVSTNVTSIGERAFESCSRLASLAIPNSVTNIASSAFSGCTWLTSVTIPSCVTSMWSLFASACWNITDVTLADGTTQIADRLFDNCDRMRTVTIPNTVTNIGDSAFEDCSDLSSVAIPASVRSIGRNAFSRTGLTSLVIPDGVMRIGDSAFSMCYSMKSVTIPNSVTSIGTFAFNGCHGLVSVTIPECVTSMRTTFDSVCWSITNVAFATGTTRIPDNFFADCWHVKSVTISEGVMDIGAFAFNGCPYLPTVMLPSSVASIGTGAFASCISMKSIQVDADNPYFASADGLLYDKGFGTLIAYPGGLSTMPIRGTVMRIGEYALYNNLELTSFLIPNGVTDVGECAFCACHDMSSFVIPKSVTCIETNAFADCDSLTTVYVDAGDETRIEGLLTDSGLDCSNVLFKAYIPVPALADPTSEDVKAVMEKATDVKLAAKITTGQQYEAFRAWAAGVGGPGEAAIGCPGVMASEHAWLSFALDCAALIQDPPGEDAVKVEAFEPSATSGKFDFTVSVEGVEVGSEATKENLKQVFGLMGGSSLDAMSSDGVELTFGTPEDGKVKFTAGPKDAAQATFFMKVKMDL